MKFQRPFAILFPGQASQYVGMGRDLYVHAHTFMDRCQEILQFPLLKYMFEGTSADLRKPSIAQPAIMTLSLALLDLLQTETKTDSWVKQATFVMGHSLGEYTALVATKSLSLEDGLHLVHQRGRLMEQFTHHIPFRMSAVILAKNKSYQDLEKFIQSLAKEYVVDVANINSKSQVVLSGKESDITAVTALLQQNDLATKAVDLPVGAPFHSRLVKPVAAQFQTELARFVFQPPITPVISNVTAEPIDTSHGSSIADLLLKQLYSPVRWYPSVQYVKSQNIHSFLELGPRPVLGNLLKREFSTDAIWSLTDYKDVLNFIDSQQLLKINK